MLRFQLVLAGYSATMRFWLSKSSEVPLREQLQAQIILGILSDDLKPGQRLPSTRELSRRYEIHANTVSAAYRELGKRGWVQFRKGSGVYVSRTISDPLDGKLGLDRLVALLFKEAREQGFSLGDVQSRLRHWLAIQPPDHFLVIEPDAELRRILIAEIAAATRARVLGIDLAQYAAGGCLTGAVPVTLPAQVEKVRSGLPAHIDLLVIQTRSITAALQGQSKPPADAMIAIVSRWPEFLRWSRAILVAAGLDPLALSFRDARERGWQKGLKHAVFVITDSVTANDLPAGCKLRVVSVLSDASMAELQRIASQFVQVRAGH